MKYIVINTKKYFDESQFLKFLEDFKEHLKKDKTILACDSSFYDLIKNNGIMLCMQSFDNFNKDSLFTLYKIIEDFIKS